MIPPPLGNRVKKSMAMPELHTAPALSRFAAFLLIRMEALETIDFGFLVENLHLNKNDKLINFDRHPNGMEWNQVAWTLAVFAWW